MTEPTRRDLFKYAGVAAAAFGVTSLPGGVPGLRSDVVRRAGADAPWNDDPESPIGPPRWGDIGYPVCSAGQDQSPVNIRTDRTARYLGPPQELRYERSEVAVLNTGHYVEVPIPPGTDDTLRIDDDMYRLVQYHFHAPAEHAVDGRLADVEAHYVHTSDHGATAVVGVRYYIGSDPNALLDAILLAAPETAGEEVVLGKASPAELLENISGVTATPEGAVHLESFYSYRGSLTTPDCAEGLKWAVLAGEGQVSKAAVIRFHRLIARFPYYNGYPNNNRPLQPLNGRIIRARHAGQHP